MDQKNDCIIGGVSLEPNYMSCLFLIPPYDNEFEKVLGKLKNILISWSDKSEEIYAGNVKQEYVKYYQRLGFRTGESRRCMIRPTEKFQVIWNDDYRIAPARKENQMEIAEFYKDAFKNVEDFQSKLSVEEINGAIQDYFDNNSEDSLVNKASTLVYDKKTNQLIGASLISIWEEWPNVYDFAVKPSFQGKGIGNNMLKYALTILKEEYPVLRLFVTLGNDAELFYSKLGFLSGIETTEMILPAIE
ncbi:GNAT family N-acetyltransferase [Clostridium sp.]|uniref:GNAT family N-acetyltransferase n=1 Tax=Clostridium sp. TaxID=1506 RepID=UPI0032163A50